MQPSGYPLQPERLAAAWQRFMDGGPAPADGPGPLDPEVLQSWRRCAPRLDPRAQPRPNLARGPTLASVLKAQANLAAVATPFMEDMHQFLEGAGCAVLLADAAACVAAVLGDPQASAGLEAASLGQGAYWAEGQLGTNALGLALWTAMPAQVVGAEHYFQALHGWTSNAAPVHDVRGRICGLIATVGPLAGSSPYALSLVMAAARAISNQLLTDWYLEEANHHLSEVNTVLGAVSEGIIAWDEAGVIRHVNAPAGQMLHIVPSAYRGRALAEALPNLAAAAAAHQEGVSELELALSPAGRPVACLLSLRPIAGPGQMPSGVIATLRPVEQVRQLVQRQLGATAALSLDDLVSRSAGMRQVVRQARIAARGAAPVLIRGEGGAGKNPLARAIHNEGQRADKPFLALDCRAIPHELMASELLGYERDASRQGRPSKFELAAGGTLLLDQIESLTLEMQAALLSALETGHFLRLGGQRPIALDARIMAATAADLERLVAEGSFIAHLYYRFGVFNLSLPPLRLRPEDIEELIERFLGRLAGQDGGACRVDAEAAGLLARYPWPGNVRELESALERAAAHCRDGLIRLVDLPERVRSGRPLGLGAPPPEPPLSVADAEREAIIRAGRAAGGRVGEMAGLLRIGRTTLWRKMKRLNLSPADFKG